MEDVKDRMNLRVAPGPWEQFDLICGSGFGGLLALMLGRLRMVRLLLRFIMGRKSNALP